MTKKMDNEYFENDLPSDEYDENGDMIDTYDYMIANADAPFCHHDLSERQKLNPGCYRKRQLPAMS